MLSMIGKAALALFEQELIKEEPEIQRYLINELNILATHLEEYLNKKFGNSDKDHV